RLLLAFSVAILVGTGVLFAMVKKGFIPTQDIGRIDINTEAAQGTSFDEMVRRQKRIAEIVQEDPNVKSLMSIAGGAGGASGAGASNTGRLIVALKPRKERPSGVDDVVAELRRKFARIPGITVFPQIPPAIQIGGRQAKSQYQFTMQSGETSLYPAAQKLVDAAKRSDKLQDVTSDLQLNNPQVNVQIDRTRAAVFGVTAQQIETALYDAYGSRQVSTIYTPANEYWVILELLPQYQQDLSALSLLYVKSPNGTLVPLSSVATLRKTAGPVAVNHSGQLPSLTLS